MKVVQFEGKLFEVVQILENGTTKGYPLKPDRTRNKAYKFPVVFPTHLSKKLDGHHEEGIDEARRKIQQFIAQLSFAERMILQQEVCGKDGTK